MSAAPIPKGNCVKMPKGMRNLSPQISVTIKIDKSLIKIHHRHVNNNKLVSHPDIMVS